MVRIGTVTLRATGSASILKRLMDARHEAQSTGIQVTGTISGGTIAVTGVRTATRRIAPPTAPPVSRRPPAPVARRKLERIMPRPEQSRDVVLFEAEIEGTRIRLLATPPG